MSALRKCLYRASLFVMLFTIIGLSLIVYQPVTFVNLRILPNSFNKYFPHFMEQPREWPHIFVREKTDLTTYDPKCVKQPRFGWIPPEKIEIESNNMSEKKLNMTVTIENRSKYVSFPVGSYIQDFFAPRMNTIEKETMLQLMDELHNLWLTKGIPYFLYAGSLLGAVRHQGFIPWDDDIDVVIDLKDKEFVFEYFKNKSIYGIKTYKAFNQHAKIYHKASKRVDPYCYDWAWPTLDVFYWKNDGKTVSIGDYGVLKWPTNKVFPLVERKFENRRYLLPYDYHWANTKGHGYNYASCLGPGYAHNHEIVLVNGCRLNCAYLKYNLPFTSWTRSGNITIATTKIGDRVLDVEEYDVNAVAKTYATRIPETSHTKVPEVTKTIRSQMSPTVPSVTTNNKGQRRNT